MANFLVQGLHWGFDFSKEDIFPVAKIISIYVALAYVGCMLLVKDFAFIKIDKGNIVKPATYIFLTPKLSNGATRFILYSTGVSLKLPPIFEQIQEIELNMENERVNKLDKFITTLENTSIEIIPSISWKIHRWNTSAYLQNVLENDEPEILKQIEARLHMIIEEYITKNYKSEGEVNSVDKVRSEQTKITKYAAQKLRKFAANLGVELFDVAFIKCDYSDETQKQLNKLKETEIIPKMAKTLTDMGVDPEQASVQAAAMAGVGNAKISHHTFEIKASDEVAQALKEIAPSIKDVAELINKDKVEKKGK